MGEEVDCCLFRQPVTFIEVIPVLRNSAQVNDTEIRAFRSAVCGQIILLGPMIVVWRWLTDIIKTSPDELAANIFILFLVPEVHLRDLGPPWGIEII